MKLQQFEMGRTESDFDCCYFKDERGYGFINIEGEMVIKPNLDILNETLELEPEWLEDLKERMSDWHLIKTNKRELKFSCPMIFIYSIINNDKPLRDWLLSEVSRDSIRNSAYEFYNPINNIDKFIRTLYY